MVLYGDGLVLPSCSHPAVREPGWCVTCTSSDAILDVDPCRAGRKTVSLRKNSGESFGIRLLTVHGAPGVSISEILRNSPAALQAPGLRVGDRIVQVLRDMNQGASLLACDLVTG